LKALTMNTNVTRIAMTALLAIAGASFLHAGESTSVLLADMGWDSFAKDGAAASVSWAGETEHLADSTGLLGKALQRVVSEEDLVDVELLTALPAPEPPALVLAGMAIGGVVFSRSLLTRRRNQGGKAGSRG